MHIPRPYFVGRGGCAFGVSFFAFSAITDIYYRCSTTRLFLGVFSFLHLVHRPGRRRSHAVSRRFFFVFEPGTQTRIPPSPSSFRSNIKLSPSSLQFSVVESRLTGRLTRLLADSGRVVSKGGERRVRISSLQAGKDADFNKRTRLS